MTYAADERVDAYIDALPDWQQAICRAKLARFKGSPRAHPHMLRHTCHDHARRWR